MARNKFITTMEFMRHIALQRLERQQDLRVLVTGATGSGKSTFVIKFLSPFPNYDPYKHQIYCADDLINLMENQERGFIFDDESINSVDNQGHQSQEQRKIVREMTMGRHKGNIIFMVTDKFKKINKKIRDLMHMRIHVRKLIKKDEEDNPIIMKDKDGNKMYDSMGNPFYEYYCHATIHLAKNDNEYAEDSWEIDENERIGRSMMGGEYRPEMFTTYEAELTFNDVTEKQRELYEKVRAFRKNQLKEKEDVGNPNNKTEFLNTLLELIKFGRIKTTKELEPIAISHGMKPNNLQSQLIHHLKTQPEGLTLKEFFEKHKKNLPSKEKSEKKQLLFNQKPESPIYSNMEITDKSYSDVPI